MITDRVIRLCVFVCGAIVLGTVGNALRTGHVAYGPLITCAFSFVTGTLYLISRARSERKAP